jgi:hypothetical protein
MRVDLALIEYAPDGGARLLGRTSDPDLIEAVRERLLAAQQEQLAQLQRQETPPRLRPIRADG